MAANETSVESLTLELERLRKHTHELEAKATRGEQAEARAFRLSRIFRVIRQINQLVSRATDPETLLQHCCQVLVDHYGYQAAWVVLFDPQGQIQGLTQVGLHHVGFELASLLQQKTLPGCVQAACTQLAPLIEHQDCCQGCVLAPHSARLGRAWSLRLMHQDRLLGVLSVCSVSSQPCADEEQEMLLAVANDLAFALHKLTIAQERERIELALRESEERLRTLIDAMPDIVCFKDGKGRWLVANDFDLRLFQLEGVDYQGKKDSELAEYCDYYREAFLNCEETDELAWKAAEVSRCDEVIPRPEGPARIFDVIKLPVFYPDGQRKGLVVVGREVTEHRRAEEERVARLSRVQRQRHAIATISTHGAVVSGRFEDAAKAITELTAETLQVERASIWLLSGNRQQLRCFDLWDRSLGAHSNGTVLDASECPQLFELLQSSRTLDVTQARTDPRTQEWCPSYLEPERISALLLATAINSGQLVAMVCYEQRSEERQWTDDEVSFAGAIGDQVAQALANRARSRAEEELHEIRERLELALKGADLGLWDWHVQTNRYVFNERWAEMLGYGTETLEPSFRTFRQLLHPDDAPRVLQELEDHLQGQTPFYESEHRLRARSGEERWVLARGRVVEWDANEQPVRVTGTHLDITERKRTELALRESEEQFAQFMDNIPAAILILSEESRLLYANKYTRESFGADDSWIGKAPGELFAPEYATPLLEQDAKTLQLGQSVSSSPMPQRNQTVRHYEHHKFVIHRPGRPSLIGGISLDVSDLKRSEEERTKLEAQLLQAQKMEAVGRLAGGIAHDFNNLLSPILGCADLALLRLQPGDPLYTHTRLIRDAAERAAGLTRQLLAFSRKQMLDMKVLNLNHVVTEFQKMLQRLIGEDIELVTSLDPKLGPVRADSAQIQQILMNLAVNARDAMPDGGRLTLETTNTIMDEQAAKIRPYIQPGSYVVLAVSDTGHGMDQETASRVFEPFFTTKERGKGTGLGLSTVYGIVKQHGGQIWVYSEVAKGTTFKVYLPRVDAPLEHEALPPAALPTAQGNETVLVVEDEEMVRNLACEILQSQGYQVLKASDAENALKMASTEQRIDLLLTDVVMPRMNGKDLYKRLVSLRPGIKVLFMSGYTDNTVAHHTSLQSGVHFLQKPFSVSHLTQKVRQALDQA